MKTANATCNNRPLINTEREPKSDVLKLMKSQSYGTQVVHCIMEVDGLCVDVDYWKELVTQFTKCQELYIFLVFGETVRQWHSTKSRWDPEL